MAIVTAEPTQLTAQAPSTTKYLKLSKDQKRAHVEGYAKSNLTKQVYCE